MSAPEPRINEFQQRVLAALRALAEERGYAIENDHMYSYSDGDSPAFDMGGVPLEIAPDQATIASPYNTRVFHVNHYRDTDVLIDDLKQVVTAFAEDPTQMRHPAVRLWKRLFGIARDDGR